MCNYLFLIELTSPLNFWKSRTLRWLHNISPLVLLRLVNIDYDGMKKLFLFLSEPRVDFQTMYHIRSKTNFAAEFFKNQSPNCCFRVTISLVASCLTVSTRWQIALFSVCSSSILVRSILQSRKTDVKQQSKYRQFRLIYQPDSYHLKTNPLHSTHQKCFSSLYNR